MRRSTLSLGIDQPVLADQWCIQWLRWCSVAEKRVDGRLERVELVVVQGEVVDVERVVVRVHVRVDVQVHIEVHLQDVSLDDVCVREKVQLVYRSPEGTHKHLVRS